MQQGMQQQSPYGQGPGFGPPPPGPRALGPGGRVAGALICAVLLAVEIAWTVRDARAVGFHDTVRLWLGLDSPTLQQALLATGPLDAVLIVVLVGALAWSGRPGAGWAFLTAGIFAFGYRLPGVWIFQSDWTEGAPLHTRALATAIGFSLAGIALVMIALAGRRPARGTAPVPSRRAVAVAAGALLVLLAVEQIGWQIFFMHKYTTANHFRPHLYAHLLSGKLTLTSLLAAPGAYAGWLWVVLGLATAAAAFARSPAARPLGIAVAFTAAFSGVLALDYWHARKRLFDFDGMPAYLKTQQITSVAELLVGLAVLVLLAVPGIRGDSPWPVTGWGPPRQEYGGAPSPGGWGPSSPPSPYSPPPQPPQGPPTVGGFGPPPPLPPDFPPDGPGRR
jgi:hypothetical protein